MSDWHIAQTNVGTALHPREDARMAGFYDRLDEINALADRSPGFVWRLQSESGNATDIRVTDDPLFMVNLSVWNSVEALFEFAYKTAHQGLLTGRRNWFRRPDGPYQALWWVPAGHLPSVDEALARLERLREAGPTAEAFTFRSKFPPPDERGVPEDLQPDPYCAGWS